MADKKREGTNNDNDEDEKEEKKEITVKEGGNISQDLWDFILLCFHFVSHPWRIKCYCC